MKPIKLFMETTSISVDKTVSEIQTLLGKFGCSGVMTLYDENKEISAVCFQVMFLDKNVPFKLPCRWKAVLKNFTDRRCLGERLSHKESDDVEQSKRVAWRLILRWTQAQLSLAESDMVKVQEVFLPYVQTGQNETLYEKLENKGFAALEYKS